MAIAEKNVLLKERIKYILALKKTSINRISDSETERIRLSRQINGDQTLITFDTIYKLLYMFQDISADWLILGEGSMYKSDHIAPHVYTQHNEVKGNSAGGDINVGPDSVITKKTVDTLESRIKELNERIAELEKDKQNMQFLIDALTIKHAKK